MSRWQNIEYFGKTPKLIPTGSFQVPGWQDLVLLKNLDSLKIIIKFFKLIDRCLGGRILTTLEKLQNLSYWNFSGAWVAGFVALENLDLLKIVIVFLKFIDGFPGGRILITLGKLQNFYILDFCRCLGGRIWCF